MTYCFVSTFQNVLYINAHELKLTQTPFCRHKKIINYTSPPLIINCYKYNFTTAATNKYIFVLSILQINFLMNWYNMSENGETCPR